MYISSFPVFQDQNNEPVSNMMAEILNFSVWNKKHKIKLANKQQHNNQPTNQPIIVPSIVFIILIWCTFMMYKVEKAGPYCMGQWIAH